MCQNLSAVTSKGMVGIDEDTSFEKVCLKLMADFVGAELYVYTINVYHLTGVAK